MMDEEEMGMIDKRLERMMPDMGIIDRGLSSMLPQKVDTESRVEEYLD